MGTIYVTPLPQDKILSVKLRTLTPLTVRLSLIHSRHMLSPHLLSDFCLWGPPEYGRQVGDIEGIMVAYCTKPIHGTRLIPAGALQGVQFMRTPDYVQAVGFIDQTAINILRNDSGGEMDPHGADLVSP